MELDLAEENTVAPSAEEVKVNKKRFFGFPDEVSLEIYQSMKEQAEFFLTKARVNLLLNFPFFGSLSTSLKTIPTMQIATLGTDGYNLWYNPIFVVTMVKKYPEEGQAYLNFILCHEILHCTNEHIGTRRMGHRNMIVEDQHGQKITLWNIAADYIVNWSIETDVAEIDQRNSRVKPLKDFIKRPPSCLFNNEFANWTTEEVYDHLMEKSEKNGGKITLPDGSLVDDHSNSHDPKESNAEKEKRSDYWKMKTEQALISQKMQGELPNSLKRINDALFGDAEVDWKEELMQYVVSCAGDDYRMLPPNKRHRKIMLPSHHSEFVKFTFAYDTSGSMGEEEIKLGVRENKGAASAFDNCQFRLISCDAAVHGDITVDVHSADFDDHLDDIFQNIKGGGGTDFRPVFDLIAEDEDECTTVLIFFTDGYGVFPEYPPEYDVIWVRRPQDLAAENFPFGRVITINNQEDRNSKQAA